MGDGTDAGLETVVPDLVPVHFLPCQIGGAKGCGGFDEVRILRLFGHQIDRAACGGTPTDGAGRPFGDLDLFGHKGFAHGNAGISHAVDEDVVRGPEATDEQNVTECVSSFAGAQCDAGCGAGKFADRRRILVAQHVLRHGGNSARRVHQRLRQQRVARPNRLISGFGIGEGRQAVLAGNRRGRCGGGCDHGGLGYDRRGGRCRCHAWRWRGRAFLGGLRLGLGGLWFRGFNFDPGEQERLVAGLRIKRCWRGRTDRGGGHHADAAAGRVAPQAVGCFRLCHIALVIAHSGCF